MSECGEVGGRMSERSELVIEGRLWANAPAECSEVGA